MVEFEEWWKDECFGITFDYPNKAALYAWEHQQTKIDELQARIDEALHTADESCGVSVAAFVKLNRILKGNKDEN